MAKTIIDFLLRPLFRYPRTLIFCSLLLWLPGVFQKNAFFVVWRVTYTAQNYFASFFIFYIVCCLALFLSRTNHYIEKGIIGMAHFVAYAVLFWELSLFVLFDCQTNANVFQLIDETNPQESFEFIEGYLVSLNFLIICCVPLIIALLEIKFLILLKFLDDFINKFFVKIKFVFKLFLLVIVGLSGSAFFYNLQFYSLDFREDWKKVDYKCVKLFPVFYIYQSFSQFFQERDLFEESSLSNENIVVDKVDSIPKTIVLIIGESFNRHHSSLYGYSLKTNPKLATLENLFVFKDVIAPMNATSDVFRDFLSMASIDESRKWYQAPFFPAIFNRAGFNVVFYSNQFVAQANMNTYDASCGFFNHPSLAPKLFDYRNEEKYEYDGDLLEAYRKQRMRIESDSLNLIIFHLFGQHVLHEKRFPQNFTFFTGKDYAFRTELNDRQKQEVANYDNATLYNDSIVYEIMKMYENQNAIVVYFSDHGDEVNDYRLHVGRSRGLHIIGAPGLHCQLDIPFLIWMSNKWRENNPDDEMRIRNHINSRFVIDDVSHLLLDLAGIETPYYNSKRDLISADYNESRIRIIQALASDPVDYDSICGKYGDWKIGF